MITYSIGAPPKAAGIYLLTHRPTKRKYVGQAVNLKHRWGEWRWAFAAGGAHTRNRELAKSIAETDPNDWDFSVLTIVEKPDDLDRLEAHVIQTLVASVPHLVLNRRERTPEPQKGIAAMPKTHLVDDKGNMIPYRTAAEIMGISQKAVVKRLAALRSKNVFKVRLCRKNKTLFPA